MAIRTLACPKCGGPLPPDAASGTTTCPYCGATVTVDEWTVSAASYRRALEAFDDDPAFAGRERVFVAGFHYVIEGRIARGERSDVFLARRARPLTERVIIKVSREPGDEAALERERKVLAALAKSRAQGAPHFTQRLPQLVGHGGWGGASGPPALVLRHASGFVHTFEAIRAAYPAGVDGRHAVWMWRRVLETLGFIHRAGFLHGAVEPAHLLVHARDHGVLLVGFGGAPPPPGMRASIRADLATSARSIAYVLGAERGSAAPPSGVPRPLAELVRRTAEPSTCPADDAWTLAEQVGRAAREAYGPPAFHRFEMPADF